jgi:small subunit ribosomal protein S15
MAVAEERRKGLIEEYRRHGSDSGSPEIQIALLTERIGELNQHLRGHRHDHIARRGLLMMVGQRNRLLKFLSRTHRDHYQETIKRLGLRK